MTQKPDTQPAAAHRELEKVAVKIYCHLHKTLTGHEPETPFQKADYRNIEFIGQYLRGAYGNGAWTARSEGAAEARRAAFAKAADVLSDYLARLSISSWDYPNLREIIAELRSGNPRRRCVVCGSPEERHALDNEKDHEFRLAELDLAPISDRQREVLQDPRRRALDTGSAQIRPAAIESMGAADAATEARDE